MFIHVVAKKDGPSYVYLKETRRNAAGLPKSVTLRSFGRLDRLLASDPQALEKLKAKYDGTGNPSDVQRARTEEMAREILSGEQKQELEALPSVCYGMMPLLKLWNDDFRMDYCLSYIRRHDTKIEFDAASYAAFLCFLKVIDPSSINSSFDDALTYAGDFLRDVKLDELYRTYDFLAEKKDKILAFANKRLDEVARKGKKASMVFYDVTNAYFETMLADEEKGLKRPGAAEAAAEAIGAADPDEIPDEAFIWGEDGKCRGIDYSMLPQGIRQAIRTGSHLRMRGPSKEHRTDLPIVSMAMAIDEWGMPMDFQIYSGASSEARTMSQSISAMKGKYDIKDKIVVADRGLNSADNLDMLLSNECGFLVAQKVTCLDKATHDSMLSDEGWTWRKCHDGEEPDLRYKIIHDYEKVSSATGRTVKCTLVLTWSRSRARRDSALLEIDAAKARDAVKEKFMMGGRRQAWAGLVCRDKDTPKAKSFNTKAYDKRRELCGYAALVYSKAPGSARDLTDEELFGSCRMLERIEENFRVMKSNLSLRPMHVKTEAHITGHVLLCVLALMLARRLQGRLDAIGRHMSVERISDALKSAWITPLARKGADISDNRLMYVRSNRHGRMRFTREEIHSKALCYEDLVAKLAEDQPDLDSVLEACGLKQVPALFDRAAFSRCMGHRFPSDEDVVGRGMIDHLVAEGVLSRS